MSDGMDRLADIKQRNEADDRMRFPSWQDVSWLTHEVTSLRSLNTELLEAVKDAYELLSDDDSYNPLVAKLDAVIAKAEPSAPPAQPPAETPEDDTMALRAVATAARAVAAAGMKPETLAGHAALTHLYEALDALDSSHKNKPPAETPAAINDA